MKKSLVELLEARQKAADELSEVKLKKATITTKLKSATIEDDVLEQLKTALQVIFSSCLLFKFLQVYS